MVNLHSSYSGVNVQPPRCLYQACYGARVLGTVDTQREQSMDSTLSSSQFNESLDNFLTIKKRRNVCSSQVFENRERHMF